jgi:hypothetical protein
MDEKLFDRTKMAFSEIPGKNPWMLIMGSPRVSQRATCPVMVFG